jgi:hypothetical protein
MTQQDQEAFAAFMLEEPESERRWTISLRARRICWL